MTDKWGQTALIFLFKWGVTKKPNFASEWFIYLFEQEKDIQTNEKKNAL